ncbi:hypothetical protein GCM10023307_38120 [Lysobacter hankyongensis]|uniref:Uncharacterized protein n=2 Tax=Lysobacter hankyongensis TaxID=1176535 RepID=A0ABP9CER6_9GAMM
MPAVPIRLSVPEAELYWCRRVWLLVPLMILVLSLVVGVVSALRLGTGAGLAYMLDGFCVAVFVAIPSFAMFRWDIAGLCEVALLYPDRIVVLCDGREISLRMTDVKSVHDSSLHWMRDLVKMDCRVNGRTVRFCFFPRNDPEFLRWELGSPFSALWKRVNRQTIAW